MIFDFVVFIKSIDFICIIKCYVCSIVLENISLGDRSLYFVGILVLWFEVNLLCLVRMVIEFMYNYCYGDYVR